MILTCTDFSFGVLFARQYDIVLVAMSFNSSPSSITIFSGLSFSLSASHSSFVIFSVLQVFTFNALIAPSHVSKVFTRCRRNMKSPHASKGSIEMLEPFADVIPCSFTLNFFFPLPLSQCNPTLVQLLGFKCVTSKNYQEPDKIDKTDTRGF